MLALLKQHILIIECKHVPLATNQTYQQTTKTTYCVTVVTWTSVQSELSSALSANISSSLHSHSILYSANNSYFRKKFFAYIEPILSYS